MQKQNLSQGGFVPKNRQHNRKTKYPDKVTKPKCLVFVRIFLFSSVGIKIQYFPTAPFLIHKSVARTTYFFCCLERLSSYSNRLRFHNRYEIQMLHEVHLL